MLLNNIFEVAFAKFKNNVLGSFTIFTSGVVNLEHPYHIFTIFKLIEYFILSTDVFTSLLSSLNGHCLLGFEVQGFEYIPE